LARSPHLVRLTTLDLQGNDIGNAGAEALVVAARAHRFDSLDLADNRISEDKKDQLRAGFAEGVLDLGGSEYEEPEPESSRGREIAVLILAVAIFGLFHKAWPPSLKQVAQSAILLLLAWGLWWKRRWLGWYVKVGVTALAVLSVVSLVIKFNVPQAVGCLFMLGVVGALWIPGVWSRDRESAGDWGGLTGDLDDEDRGEEPGPEAPGRQRWGASLLGNSNGMRFLVTFFFLLLAGAIIAWLEE
jgi:hypothetical protein